MKRSMKKFMVTCAAVTAIAAVASVSAMAADYTDTDNSVKYTVPGADADTQMTLLVIPEAAKDAVTDADILGIDQDAALSGTALLKGDSLADGTYLVKVGYYKDGAFAIAEETFTVGSTETREILLGDVANPAGITAIDAQQVLKYSATGEAGFASDADKLIAADVAKPAGITAIDAQQILKYAASGQESQNVGKTAVVDANGTVIEIK